MAKVKETWLLVDNQQIDCKPKWEMFVTITTQEESDFISTLPCPDINN